MRLFTVLVLASVAAAEEPGVVRIPDSTEEAITIEGEVGGMLLRDLNADGYPDLFLAVNQGGRDKESVLFLSNKGRFDKPSWTSDDPGVSAGVAVADLDGDGKEDLILTRYNHNPAVAYRGKGGGQFDTSPFWQSVDTEWAYRALAGDFNGDGFSDLLAEDRVYFGAKGGLETSYSWKMEGDHTPSSLAIDDVDGDGRKDLVICNWFNGAAWEMFRGVKEGFEAASSASSAARGEFHALSLGDITGDGRPEVVVGAAARRGGDGRVRMFANDKGALSPRETWISDDLDCQVTDTQLVDADGDGDLDLFVLAGERTAIFENRKGTLSTQPCWRASVDGESAAVLDLDKDGFLDLVVSNQSAVRFFRGGAKVEPPKADPFPAAPKLPPLTARDLLPDMDPAVEKLIETWRAAATPDERKAALEALRPRAAEVSQAMSLMKDAALEPVSNDIAADVEKEIATLVAELGSETWGECTAAQKRLVACGTPAVALLKKASGGEGRAADLAKETLKQISARPPVASDAIEVLGMRFARLTDRLRLRYGLPKELEGVVVLHMPEGFAPSIDLANMREGDVFQGIGGLGDYGHKVDETTSPLGMLGLVLRHDAEGERTNRGWRLAGYRYTCGPLHPSESGAVREWRMTLTPKQWDEIKKFVKDPKPWEPAK